jgi:hypothetical protein
MGNNIKSERRKQSGLSVNKVGKKDKTKRYKITIVTKIHKATKITDEKWKDRKNSRTLNLLKKYEMM